MKKILIRFDDICPTMDWEQWKRAEDLLLQYNVKTIDWGHTRLSRSRFDDK